jgi:hypothetical protein
MMVMKFGFLHTILESTWPICWSLTSNSIKYIITLPIAI